MSVQSFDLAASRRAAQKSIAELRRTLSTVQLDSRKLIAQLSAAASLLEVVERWEDTFGKEDSLQLVESTASIRRHCSRVEDAVEHFHLTALEAWHEFRCRGQDISEITNDLKLDTSMFKIILGLSAL